MEDFLKTIFSAMKTWVRGNIKDSVAEIKANIKDSMADWNQNDSNLNNYIKNRTHWEENTEVVLFQDVIVVLEENYIPLNDFSNQNNSLDQLVAGQTYHVVFDNVKYKCVARRYDDCVLIGNGMIYGDGNVGNNEPFSCDSHDDGSIYLNADNGEHTISISTDDIIVHKLDSKYLPAELFKEQYIPTTERITAEVGQTIIVEEIDEEGRPAAWKAIDRNKFDAITLIDEVNNCEYIVKMKNGTLTSFCKTTKISVTTMPTKTEYLPGEPFDPTGMVVVGIRQDGTTYEIDMSTYTPPVLETPFSISYTEAGITYVAAIDLTMLSLIDFNYTSQPDGTYKIDGWKGTLNGEPSTELVVPNSPLIII